MLVFLSLNVILLRTSWARDAWQKTDSKQPESHSPRPKEIFFHNYPRGEYIPPFGINVPTSTTTTTTPTPAPASQADDLFNFQDEQMEVEPPPSPGYTYVTPSIPFDELRPPAPHDEVSHVEYLPPYKPPYPSNQNSIIPLHLEVNEMHCFDTPNDGRFQAVLTLKSNENPPVLEDMVHRNEGICEVSTNPSAADTKIRINISKKDFLNCGVKDCSSGQDVVNMCVRLRFPIMSRMRLPEDPVLTLHCRTQDRVVTQIKHLKVDVDNSVIARSGGVIAKGGNRGKIRTHVALYRRGIRGDFSEALPPRARVALGDTIMLRADVEAGDGWTSSRFGGIVMRRENANNEDGEIVLLQNDGCRSPQAHLLCPKGPIHLSPLSHALFLRAALFEGMSSGEEVRLSVKLLACLEADECRPGICHRPSDPFPRTRSRRHLDHRANTTSEVSFAIIIPEILERSNSNLNGTAVYFLFTLCLIVICIGIVLVLKKIKDVLFLNRQKLNIGRM